MKKIFLFCISTLIIMILISCQSKPMDNTLTSQEKKVGGDCYSMARP